MSLWSKIQPAATLSAFSEFDGAIQAQLDQICATRRPAEVADEFNRRAAPVIYRLPLSDEHVPLINDGVVFVQSALGWLPLSCVQEPELWKELKVPFLALVRSLLPLYPRSRLVYFGIVVAKRPLDRPDRVMTKPYTYMSFEASATKQTADMVARQVRDAVMGTGLMLDSGGKTDRAAPIAISWTDGADQCDSRFSRGTLFDNTYKRLDLSFPRNLMPQLAAAIDNGQSVGALSDTLGPLITIGESSDRQWFENRAEIQRSSVADFPVRLALGVCSYIQHADHFRQAIAKRDDVPLASEITAVLLPSTVDEDASAGVIGIFDRQWQRDLNCTRSTEYSDADQDALGMLALITMARGLSGSLNRWQHEFRMIVERERAMYAGAMHQIPKDIGAASRTLSRFQERWAAYRQSHSDAPAFHRPDTFEVACMMSDVESSGSLVELPVDLPPKLSEIWTENTIDEILRRVVWPVIWLQGIGSMDKGFLDWWRRYPDAARGPSELAQTGCLKYDLSYSGGALGTRSRGLYVHLLMALRQAYWYCFLATVRRFASGRVRIEFCWIDGHPRVVVTADLGGSRNALLRDSAAGSWDIGALDRVTPTWLRKTESQEEDATDWRCQIDGIDAD